MQFCNKLLKKHILLIYLCLILSIFISPITIIGEIIKISNIHVIRIANLLFLLTSIIICSCIRTNVIVRENKYLDNSFHNLQYYFSSLVLLITFGSIHIHFENKLTLLLVIILPFVGLWYFIKIIYNNYCIMILLFQPTKTTKRS